MSATDDEKRSTTALTQEPNGRMPETPESAPSIEAKEGPEPNGHKETDSSAEAGGTAHEEGKEDESDYPGPAALAVIMIAISMGVFLVSLDRTIISTAAPTITDAFHSSADIGWYGGAYSMTGCAMQLPLGRIYRFYPPKQVYVALILVFVVGSAVGAGARSSGTVIAGRAVQGVGLGGVLSGSTILVAQSAPLRRRPVLLGILMASMSISSVLGPLIGGALTTHAGWRWCFIVNIPIGLLIAAVMAFLVEGKPGKESARGWADKIRRLDPLGAALVLPAVVCLVLALQWAGSEYAWSDARIIVLFVLGGLLAVGFCVSQALMPETATVPPRVAGQRTVAASFLFSALTGGAMMVATYWISDWFQAIQDVSAVQAGIRTIALVLSQALGALMGGGSAQLIGFPSPVMMASATLIAVGAGMLSSLTPDAAAAQWIGYQVVLGLGLGCGTQQASLAVQAVVKEEDIPSAISLVFFGLSFGGSIFICAGQNLFNQQLVATLSQAAIPGLRVDAILETGLTSIRGLVDNGADLAKLLHAYNQALTSTFYVAAGAGAAAFLAALFVQWKSVKGIKPMH